MYIKNRIAFLLKNWKLCLHLILGTRHFGVNNQWWSSFPSSYFGLPWWRIVKDVVTILPLIRRYRHAKYRAITLGFLHPDTVKSLGWHNK
jgi:hypothetical protein